MGASLWDIRLGEAWSIGVHKMLATNTRIVVQRKVFCDRSYEPTFSTKHCFSVVNCGRSGFFLYRNDWNSQAQRKHEPFLGLEE